MGNNKMWVHLRRIVEPQDWKFIETRTLDADLSEGSGDLRVVSRKFQTNVDYKTDLKGENYVGYMSGCVFFHRKLHFTFALSLKDDSSDMKLRVIYSPRNGNKEEFVSDWNEAFCSERSKGEHHCDFDEGWYEENSDHPYCKEYFWAFDQCLVKLNLMDNNNSCIFSKRLVMDCMGMGGRGEKEDTGEVSFISINELKDSFDYDVKQGTNGFPSIVIEISAHLFVDCLTYKEESEEESEEEEMEEDEDDSENESSWEERSTAKRIKRISDTVKDKSFKLPVPLHASLTKNRIRLSTGIQFDKFKLCPDSSDCDLVLQIGSDGLQNISVHKAVLAVKSPIFRAMFGKGWEEIGNLKLDDYSFAGVKAFVGYIYENGSNVVESLDLGDLKLCLELIKLAHFYQVMDLIECCVDHIMLTSFSNYNLTLAVEMFQSGQRFNLPDLSARASQWIKKNKKRMNAKERKQLEDFIASANDKDKISFI